MQKFGVSVGLSLGFLLFSTAIWSQPASQLAGWQIETRTDSMTDFVSGFARLASNERNGSITLSCIKHGKNAVHLSFVADEFLGSGGRPAEFRFDSSPSFRALLVYTGQSAVWINLKKLLKNGVGAKLLRARLSNAQSRDVDMTFDVTDLEAAARAVAITCKDPL